MTETVGLVVLSAVTAAVGSLGGLGGAVVLVPVLVTFGMTPAEAAPLGLLSVAAGSLAAADAHLKDRLVNHRLGLVTELVASAGAIVGALAAGVVAERTLLLILAGTALVAAVSSVRRSGLRNPPDPTIDETSIGEHRGMLAGAYPIAGGVAPYTVRQLGSGLAVFAAAGWVTGTTGASGGFLRTPALSELMHVPTKVAAATTTFTVGITSAAALLVFAVQGRLDSSTGVTVVLGSLVGAHVGARVQGRAAPVVVRRCLSVVLLAVVAVLLGRA